MTLTLFDVEQWDDADCIKAWDKLCAQHDIEEIFWAMYGGMLKKDLKFGGWIAGLRQHGKKTPFINISFEKADLAETNVLQYEPEVPLETFEKIVSSFVIPPDEMAHYREVYTTRQLGNVKMSFEFSFKQES